MATPPTTSPPPIDGDGWRFSLESLPDRATLARLWRTLEQRGETPFFLTWDWIGCWLASVPSDRGPRLLKVERAGQLIGLAVVTASTGRWLGMLPVRRLHLHETGEPALDSLTIEYNGIVTEPPWREEALRRAVVWLLASHADELNISGISAALLQNCGQGLSVRLRDRKPTYVVDLARIAATGGDFMSTLSANARSQLRRAIRQFEALGPLRIAPAASSAEARDMLAHMIPLHQAYWQARGKAGAFADRRIVAFHERLIDESFARDRIQFLHCQAGASTVGYLYNFKSNNRIYAYQSGFDYELLPRARPGWICHHLAIQESLRCDIFAYDFLAGENQFKSSFAELGTELVWLSVERRGWRPTIMQALRGAKAFCSSPSLLNR